VKFAITIRVDSELNETRRLSGRSHADGKGELDKEVDDRSVGETAGIELLLLLLRSGDDMEFFQRLLKCGDLVDVLSISESAKIPPAVESCF
jgi:hypothetical protein